MMQRRRPNPSHPSIQKVIHSQNPLQQIQAELATDVKLHIPEDMRKYAKLWRQSAAIARKLDNTGQSFATLGSRNLLSIWRMRTLTWLSIVWQIVERRKEKNGLSNLPARVHANAPHNQGIYNGLCIDNSSCGMLRLLFRLTIRYFWAII